MKKYGTRAKLSDLTGPTDSHTLSAGSLLEKVGGKKALRKESLGPMAKTQIQTTTALPGGTRAKIASALETVQEMDGKEVAVSGQLGIKGNNGGMTVFNRLLQPSLLAPIGNLGVFRFRFRQDRSSSPTPVLLAVRSVKGPE